MILRICRHKGCSTQLSRFNPGVCCWFHTPDKAQEVAPLKAFKHRDRDLVTGRFIEDRNVVSGRFIDGINGTYDLTAKERAEAERWANAVAEDVEAVEA